jgi:NAD-dependent protein deacetylase/lipoamidase
MNTDLEKIKQIARALKNSKSSLIFTGAGISTESGIPDYRSKGGLWEQFKPVYFDEFMSSKDARIEYWKRKSELYPDLIKAEPNKAHLAVARLYEMGLIEAVITQNIDGLHQAAGIPPEQVIELHGNTLRIKCMSCGALESIHDVQRRINAGDLAPECKCGGFLKPDTISFGQAMPEEETNRAVNLANHCDFLLVIGSTLLVQPASLIPGYAKQNGAFLSIINLSETPYDDVCDVFIQDKAGIVLPELVNQAEC